MSSLSHQPDADAGRDPSAAARVEQLYASHSALVRSICRSLLRNAVEAEDAVQQTFLSAQRALLNGSAPRDAAPWLATIARHESFARVRARMREPLPTDSEPEGTGPDAHAVAIHRQEVGELRDALADLPAQQREALLLREVRGFSYEEVASTLSVTTSAVESLLFRARRNLQVRLRSSLALFPPGGFVRELAARLGGASAVPGATKALVVGVGAAVVTGGVVAAPRIGLGHAPQARPAASAHGAHGRTQAGASLDLRLWSSGVRPRTVAPMGSDASARHETGHESSGGDSPSRPGSSDQTESPSPEGASGGGESSGTSDIGSSGLTDSGGTSSGDTQTTSSGDGGTTTDSSSQTIESQSTTETTTTSSGPDGSGG